MGEMQTYVKNVRVKNIRPKYENLVSWMKDDDNVYVGRCNVLIIDGLRFPPKSSIWCNPYKVNVDGTLQEVLEKYKIYIENKIINENLTDELLKLKGKNLGCWCVDSDNYDNIICHAQILLELIAKYS